MRRSLSERLGTSSGVLTLAVISLVLTGLAVGWLVKPSVTPPTLDRATPVDEVAVTVAAFVDPHEVGLVVETGTAQALVAPAGARVTGTACVAGAPIRSGESTFALDGQPVLNLWSAVPFWRSLGVGDEGPDVVALQTELVRLGFPLEADGKLGQGSVNAVGELLERAGGMKIGSHVPPERLVWMPAPELIAKSCPAALGATVVAGDAVVDLMPVDASVRVAEQPTDLLEGERVLLFRGSTMPIDDGGKLSAAADVAAVTAAAVSGDQSAKALTAVLELSEPTTVAVVPPSALLNQRGQEACIIADGEMAAVRVVGSKLGQAYVILAAGGLPRSVDPSPAAGGPASC